MKQSAYCANRLNETGQWEYAPRHIEVERGRIVSQSDAVCGRETLGPDGLIRPMRSTRKPRRILRHWTLSHVNGRH